MREREKLRITPKHIHRIRTAGGLGRLLRKARKEGFHWSKRLNVLVVAKLEQLNSITDVEYDERKPKKVKKKKTNKIVKKDNKKIVHPEKVKYGRKAKPTIPLKRE